MYFLYGELIDFSCLLLWMILI